jgi:hypothetical protein
VTTLLQLIQQATGEMGLTVPTSVAGSIDKDTVQQLALLNAVGSELLRQFPWQALQKEYRFTTQYLVTTGTTTQGSAVVTGLADTTGLDSTYMVSGTGVNQDTYVLSRDSSSQVTMSQAASASGTVTINFGKTKYSLPSDYDHQADRTQYDKTKRWAMSGPQTQQQRQFLKSSWIVTGPAVRYWYAGGYMQIWPMVLSSEYIGYEYSSNAWVNSSGAVAATKQAFTADADTCIFSDRLMVLGLKKKYFEVKGFDPGFFTRDYEAELSRAKAVDSGAQTLNIVPRMGNTLIGPENIPDQGYGL